MFQDPFTSLNPSLRIGLQVAEPLIQHLQCRGAKALEERKSALVEVGLPHPEEVAPCLSASAQWRHAAAPADRSSAHLRPELVILDEPTTALDVTIEAQILDLLDASPALAPHRHAVHLA